MLHIYMCVCVQTNETNRILVVDLYNEWYWEFSFITCIKSFWYCWSCYFIRNIKLSRSTKFITPAARENVYNSLMKLRNLVMTYIICDIYLYIIPLSIHCHNTFVFSGITERYMHTTYNNKRCWSVTSVPI